MSLTLAKVKLENYISTLKGFAFKSKWYTDKGVPIVKVSDFTHNSIDCSNLVRIPKNIANNYLKYSLSKGDVVVQTVGSWPSNPASVVGKAIKVPSQAQGSLLNQNAVKIIPNEEMDKSFLFYLLKSDFFKEFIIGTAQGAASQASITLDSIKSFSFELPPLPTQKRIADILSAYDDLIENNKRRIQILEEMAQNLYREWFVKFRFPIYREDGTIERIHNPETDKMRDSQLGLIPEGWEVKKLENIAEVFRGRSYKSSELVEEDAGLPFLNLKNIQRDGGYRHDGTKRYNGPYKEHHKARTGDIIMAVTDMTQERRIVARPALVPRTDEEIYIYSMDLVKITAKESSNLEYLYCLLRFSDFSDKTKQYANGANVLHLNPAHIIEYEFASPAENLQTAFAEIYKCYRDEENVLEQKNKLLKQTRELLLPKLISGKIELQKEDIKND